VVLTLSDNVVCCFLSAGL